MRMVRCFVITAIAAIFTCLTNGCTTYRSPLSSASTLPQERGYLYGRYTFHHRHFGVWLGLIVTEQTTKTRHRIRFRTDSGIAVIDVPPGEYAVTHYTLATDMGYGLSRNIPYTPSLFGGTFRVEANHMYYIGDYVGSTYLAGMGANAVSFGSHIDKCSDDYDLTTTEIRSLYKSLNHIPASSVRNK